MDERWSHIPVKNKATGKWEVSVLTPEGTLLRVEEFGDQQTAFIAIKKNKTSVSGQWNVVSKDEAKTFLEGMINPNNIADDSFADELGMNMELEEKKAEFEQSFNEKIAETETQAKNLLNSVAKAYLSAAVINENEYLKFKLEVEQKTFGSLIFQVDVAKKAIFKLSQKIHMDDFKARDVEVLAQISRLMLDISKFQSDYLNNLEESMKKFQIDMDMSPANNLNQGVADEGVVAEISHEGGGIRTNSRKNLLIELNNMVEESRSIKTPKSRNSQLHDDDPDVIDVPFVEHKDEIADESEFDATKGGLNSYGSSKENMNSSDFDGIE